LPAVQNLLQKRPAFHQRRYDDTTAKQKALNLIAAMQNKYSAAFLQ